MIKYVNQECSWWWQLSINELRVTAEVTTWSNEHGRATTTVCAYYWGPKIKGNRRTNDYKKSYINNPPYRERLIESFAVGSWRRPECQTFLRKENMVNRLFRFISTWTSCYWQSTYHVLTHTCTYTHVHHETQF